MIQTTEGLCRLGIGSTHPLPSDAPLGVTMANMRGLIRSGFVSEKESASCFYITDAGVIYVDKKRKS
jgi:hypothetical protein